MLRLAVLLMTFWTGAGFAASFDCTKARSNIEKAICSDPTLSQLDETLASEYKKARSKLSPSADRTFVSGQRSWLRFNSTYCFVDTTASSVTSADATSCLVRAYKDRISDLSKTGALVGGFKTYIAIDHHIRVLKQQEAVYVVQRTFTQIDQDTPSGNHLNAYLSFKDKADLPDARGTENYDVKLSQISPDWLYKQTFSEIFTGAYPTSDTECEIYSISKDRPLKISDIFQGQSWKKIFETITKNHFVELAKNNKNFDITMIHDFHPSVTQASNPFTYCVSKDGIELSGFLPHVVRSYDGLTIDWKSLHKVLTPYAFEQIKKMGGL